MLNGDPWSVICEQPADVPDKCIPFVRASIVEKLGQPIPAYFPGFTDRFPLTVSAMARLWRSPVVAFVQSGEYWVSTLALQGDGQDLYFEISNFHAPVDGATFDESVAMLPAAWKELYRGFWSFSITADRYPGLYWRNTPFSYASRLRLQDFHKKYKGSKAKTEQFAKRLGSNDLRCWLLTDAGDSLWLDEQRCDKRVYHVREGAFDQAAELADSAGRLDRYLAHFVSGRSPADFDFRAVG